MLCTDTSSCILHSVEVFPFSACSSNQEKMVACCSSKSVLSGQQQRLPLLAASFLALLFSTWTKITLETRCLTELSPCWDFFFLAQRPQSTCSGRYAVLGQPSTNYLAGLTTERQETWVPFCKNTFIMARPLSGCRCRISQEEDKVKGHMWGLLIATGLETLSHLLLISPLSVPLVPFNFPKWPSRCFGEGI